MDDRFFPGWNFDVSFVFCTLSWVSEFLVGAGLVGSALFLEQEGGYELIPSHVIA